MKKLISKIALSTVLCLLLVFNTFASNASFSEMDEQLLQTGEYMNISEMIELVVDDTPMEVYTNNALGVVVSTQEEIDAYHRSIGSGLTQSESRRESAPEADYSNWQHPIIVTGNTMDSAENIIMWDDAVLYATDMAADQNNAGNVTFNSSGLALSNMTFTHSYVPAQAMTGTYIHYDIRNYNPVAAPNVQISLTVNGVNWSIVNIGTVPANASGSLWLHVQNGFAYGNNTITLTALQSARPDASVSRTQFFDGAPHLRISSLTSSGLYITQNLMYYHCQIENVGNAPANANPHVIITVNGANLGIIYLPSLPVLSGVTGQFNATYRKRGTYEVKVHPGTGFAGISATVSNFINFNTELFAGRWQNANGLTVSVDSHIITGKIMPQSFLSSYMAWNNISPYVSFNGQYTEAVNFNQSTSDFHIEVYNDSLLLAGYGKPYKRVNGNLVQVTDFYNDTSYYAKAKIEINTYYTSSNDYYVLIHEFGHGLGLAHLTCNDDAIMRSNTNDVSEYITDHDKHNLVMKYN